MRARMLVLAGGLAALVTAHAPIAAQSAAPAKAALPRTADGHPDLQGIYNVATITPVERPAGLTSTGAHERAGRRDRSSYEAARQVKNDAPIAGDRAAPPVGGDNPTPKRYLEFLERAGGGAVGGYNNFWLAPRHARHHRRRRRSAARSSSIRRTGKFRA